MATRENMFAKAAEKRKAEQHTLEKQLKGVDADATEVVVDKADVPDAKDIEVEKKSEKKTTAKKATKSDKTTTSVAAKKERKVAMNISLPAEYKRRLNEYAAAKHLSASVVLQILIDEHCKL